MKVNPFLPVVISVLVWIACPHLSLAAIHVDGVLNEPEWATAQKFTNFVVVNPYTKGKPGISTEALIQSTPEGLAVAFICGKSKDGASTHTKTERDANSFDADSVSLFVDFDGSKQFAYEFSVSMSDSIRDGTIVQENQIDDAWDGVWKHAVHEEKERWTVEMLLPWSIASMRDRSGKTRQIGVCFQHNMQASNEVYSFPATRSDRPRFISDFAQIDVKNYSAQEIDVTPYVSVLRDNVKNDISTKAGLDFFWKPSGKLNVIGTIYPDFGTVESDNIVINFSAIETVFAEKRPFFTENQEIFNVMAAGGGGPGPGMGGTQILYTRRIGGPNDQNGAPSDVEGALKVIGSTEAVNYGLFAAKETGEAGRRFYAARVLFPENNWSIGALSTYAERPYLDRTALVNSLDYDFSLLSSLKITGLVLASNTRIDGTDNDGFAFFNDLNFTTRDNRWSLDLNLQHLDDAVELNDMGYMSRNDLDTIEMAFAYNQMDFPLDSRLATVSWPLTVDFERNTEGDRFPVVITVRPLVNFRNGGTIHTHLSFNTGGYDDLISRGNGIVWINQRWNGDIYYHTPRRGMWRESFQVMAFQEGIRGWGMGLHADATWYPMEGLNANFSLTPQWSDDWLNWVQGTQLGKFSRHEVSAGISVNWFPAEGHEIWVKAQWDTLNADAIQSYHIGTGGHLVADSAPIQDFASNNFAFQFRYRYELAPMSYLWLCYSRGGNDFIENPAKSTTSLLANSSELRDADQILLKFTYRFKIL